MKTFDVLYDSDADVLYITKIKRVAARGIEEKPGVVWRYDRDGELLSVTIIDFKHHWFAKRSALAADISHKFHIPSKQARVVLDHAMDESDD